MLNRIKVLILGMLCMACLFPGTARAENRVDWAQFNPALKDAVSVGKKADCFQCHEGYIRAFLKTKHARKFKARFGYTGPETCELCHGPLSKHLQADFDSKLSTVVSFKNIEPRQKSRICLQCHERGLNLHWQGSMHEMANVSCDKCHYVMNRRSTRQMFIDEDSKKTCFQCHKDKRARILRSAHMPLREGKMSCASCHNPHGGSGPSLLKQASVNETCYACHADKRGPMLFEHGPVRENCSHCHDSHGSNHLSMLKLKVPYLCQACHSSQFHPSTLYDGTQLAPGTNNRDLQGKACLNCHSKIHGSNHPSGARFTR